MTDLLPPNPVADGNSSFSLKLPTLQLSWDSTSLGAFKECPRKYEYSILRGLVPRAESIHLVFGLLVHSCSEIYNHAKANGAPHAEALRATVRHALRESWDFEKSRPKAILADDRNKNRYTLLRTVVWYFDQFENDPLETVILSNGKPAVELSFEIPLGHDSAATGEAFSLCGHMDRVANYGGKPYVVDIKTTKNTIGSEFFEKFNPHNQFSTYLLAGRIAFGIPINGLIVDGTQIAVTFTRFQRGVVNRSDAQLDEWHRDTISWIGAAEAYALQGHWPQNDKSCDMYGGCPYREVCSKSPSVRPAFMQSLYVKRVWDPQKRRGDI